MVESFVVRKQELERSAHALVSFAAMCLDDSTADGARPVEVDLRQGRLDRISGRHTFAANRLRDAYWARVVEHPFVAVCMFVALTIDGFLFDARFTKIVLSLPAQI